MCVGSLRFSSTVFLNHSLMYMLRQCFWMNSEIIDSMTLAIQLALGDSLLLPPMCWDYGITCGEVCSIMLCKWTLQTQILIRYITRTTNTYLSDFKFSMQNYAISVNKKHNKGCHCVIYEWNSSYFITYTIPFILL